MMETQIWRKILNVLAVDIGGTFLEIVKKQKHTRRAKTTVDVKTNWALLTNQEEEDTSNQWILDSGATEYMTSDKSKLTNLINYSSVVKVVNSEKI